MFRELLDNGAIADEAVLEGKREWERREGSQLFSAVDKNTEAPVNLDDSGTAAKDAAWMEAAEKATQQARRKSLAQEAQARSKALGGKHGLAEKKKRAAQAA